MLFLCNKLIIWEDEAYSLNTSFNNLYRVINLSYNFEGQPPLYFLILSLWRKINDGIFFSRLLSLIFTLLSAVVLNKLLKINFKSLYSKWVVVLFLLNPFTIAMGLEIRLYSFLILLSLVSIYLFNLIYYLNQNRFKFHFVLICLLGVYTQYFFVFLIISLSILLIISKGWRTFFNYCLLISPVAFLFLPNFLFIGNEYNMHLNAQYENNLYARINPILDTPFQYLANIIEIKYKFGRWFLRLIVVILFLNSFYRLYNKHKINEQQDLKKIIEILVPLMVLLLIFSAIFLTTNLVYSDRYLTITYPFFCLLYSLFCIYHKKISVIIYMSYAAFFIILLINNYSTTFIKVADSKSVANYSMQIEHPEEPILFRDKSLIFAFKQYYKGDNLLISLPEFTCDYNYYNTEVSDTTELKGLIENHTNGKESFLLVNGHDHGFIYKKKLDNKTMDHFLKNNYLISLDTIFNGRFDFDFLRVRRLLKKEK